MRASGSSLSIRRRNRTWVARRSGRSAACSWSILPSSVASGISDSIELAWQDWMGTAGFRPDDDWPRQWAEAYVAFAAGEKRAWLRARASACSRSSAGPSAAATAPRARQLGAALSCHLGHRARRAGAVRSAHPRGGDQRPTTFRFRHRVDALTDDQRRGRRRQRRDPGAERGPRGKTLSNGRRRVRTATPRRSSWPPAASAAITTWYGRTGPLAWVSRPVHGAGVPDMSTAV